MQHVSNEQKSINCKELYRIMKILSSLLDVGVSDEEEWYVPNNPCKMQNRLFMQKNLAETYS